MNLQFFDEKKEKRVGDAMIAMIELLKPKSPQKNFSKLMDDDSVKSEYEEEDEVKQNEIIQKYNGVKQTCENQIKYID